MCLVSLVGTIRFGTTIKRARQSLLRTNMYWCGQARVHPVCCFLVCVASPVACVRAARRARCPVPVVAGSKDACVPLAAVGLGCASGVRSTATRPRRRRRSRHGAPISVPRGEGMPCFARRAMRQPCASPAGMCPMVGAAPTRCVGRPCWRAGWTSRCSPSPRGSVGGGNGLAAAHRVSGRTTTRPSGVSHFIARVGCVGQCHRRHALRWHRPLRYGCTARGRRRCFLPEPPLRIAAMRSWRWA